MIHSYFGPGFGRERLRAALDEAAGALDVARYEVREAPGEDDLCAEIARRIADGEVLGWF